MDIDENFADMAKPPGAHQDYAKDCPVCCHPMTLHVDIDPVGEARVEGEHE
jgi:hypothetical protein